MLWLDSLESALETARAERKIALADYMRPG
jgi:hypothetical protein